MIMIWILVCFPCDHDWGCLMVWIAFLFRFDLNLRYAVILVCRCTRSTSIVLELQILYTVTSSMMMLLIHDNVDQAVQLV